MSKTKWLLDFDGVINANKAGWSAAPFSGNVYASGNHYRIRWAPQLIQRIRRIHALPGVEILWASSWIGHTAELEQLIKLPTLLSAAPKGMSGEDKLQAASEIMESGNRLIWTDDEYTLTSGELYDKWTASGRALLIQPKPNRGLRPEHLDKIDAFVLGSCT